MRALGRWGTAVFLTIFLSVVAASGCTSHSLAGGGGGGVGGSVTGGGGVATGVAGSVATGGCAPPAAPAGGSVFTGDLSIYTTAEATAAQAYTEVTGTLLVGAAAVDLPRLRKVGGDLYASSSSIVSFSAPNLTSVGGQLYFYLCSNLLELDLRSLQSVGQRAWVYRDIVLQSLRLDAFTTAGAEVSIQDNLKLLPCVVDDIEAHGPPGAYVGFANPACHCETICGHAQQLCP
jgi:hypothetical protein